MNDKDLKAWLKQRKHPKGKSVGDGLMFRVSPQGSASWALRYRFNGRQRYFPIGRYPAVTLEAARIAATKAWARIYSGVDVAREKRRERIEANSAMSFCALAEDYLQRGGKALVERSQEEVGRFLKLDLAPRIGHMAARDNCSDDIVSLVEHVAKRSDSVARRCFGLISIIFAHGVAKGIVKANPCGGLRLTAILGPRPAPKPRIKLTREELSIALASFPTLGPVIALACKILLATCVRKSELAPQGADLAARRRRRRQCPELRDVAAGVESRGRGPAPSARGLSADRPNCATIRTPPRTMRANLPKLHARTYCTRGSEDGGQPAVAPNLSRS